MPKFLYYPIQPFHINQAFGLNPQTYSQFGLKGHNGLDLRAFHGQPVYAAHDGIAFFESDNSGGEGVVIVSDEKIPYDAARICFSTDQTMRKVNYKTIYWHLCDEIKDPKFKSPVLLYQRANKGQGMPVKAGDIIGYADNTGFSTGDHLHFGLKPVVSGPNTPSDGTDDANYQNVSQLNGFLGAIDPAPYFTTIPAQNVPEIIVTQKKVIPLLQQIIDLLWSRISIKNNIGAPMPLSMVGVGGTVTAIEAVAAFLGFDFPQGSVAAAVNGVVAVIGLLTLAYGQYRRGDVKLFFFKKQ